MATTLGNIFLTHCVKKEEVRVKSILPLLIFSVLLSACASKTPKNTYEDLFQGTLEPVNTQDFKDNFMKEAQNEQ